MITFICPHCGVTFEGGAYRAHIFEGVAYKEHVAACSKKVVSDAPKSNLPVRVEDTERCVYCRHLVVKTAMQTHIRSCRSTLPEAPKEEPKTKSEVCRACSNEAIYDCSIRGGPSWCRQHAHAAGCCSLRESLQCKFGQCRYEATRLCGKHDLRLMFCVEHQHSDGCCKPADAPWASDRCQFCYVQAIYVCSSGVRQQQLCKVHAHPLTCCVLRPGVAPPSVQNPKTCYCGLPARFLCYTTPVCINHFHTGIYGSAPLCCKPMYPINSNEGMKTTAAEEVKERVYTRESTNACWCKLEGLYTCKRQAGAVCAVHVHRDLQDKSKFEPCCKPLSERTTVVEKKERFVRVLEPDSSATD